MRWRINVRSSLADAREKFAEKPGPIVLPLLVPNKLSCAFHPENPASVEFATQSHA
jgi:hypothetical protein